MRASNYVLCSIRAVCTLWRRFGVCLCEPQTSNLALRLKSCCVHTLAPCTLSQIVLCTHFGAGSKFACASLSSSHWSFHIGFSIKQHANNINSPGNSSWSSAWVYLDPTLSWRFLRRKHSPGDPSWIYTDSVVQCLGSQTFSWRFFRRRHSPGDSSWIYLDTVLQSVLGHSTSHAITR